MSARATCVARIEQPEAVAEVLPDFLAGESTKLAEVARRNPSCARTNLMGFASLFPSTGLPQLEQPDAVLKVLSGFLAG
jgi:hypothetical protein